MIMALLESGTAFLKDIFDTVMQRKGVSGTILGVLLGGGGLHLYENADIIHQVAPKTADLAKYGEVTPELYCAEQVKFSEAFNAYMAAKTKDSKIVSPVFQMTEEACLSGLKPKAAAPR
jgi:hypothetical protein